MSGKPVLIGIGGGSASGKTSFLRDLAAQLPGCSILSQDNYYHPMETQQRDSNGWFNFDLPGAIDRERFHADLRSLLRGESVTKTEYTFNQPRELAATITIHPAAVLIVEGLFLFHYSEIRTVLDLSVFLEADEAICKQRRIDRDQRERGYSAAEAIYQWENHVLPAYRQYVLPYRDQAHVIVANHTDYDVGLATVVQHVQQLMSANEPRAPGEATP
jgi:uridine kinase